ncbi:MAG TPA: galactokinase [Ktedonobacteraceae bacterium]|nr:galactokinase [Ktedonobacteraceae bacterium]
MEQEKSLPGPAREGAAKFAEVFQTEEPYATPLRAAWAPGRVNLIGEHTDYNGGFVLPVATDRVAAFAGRPREDGIVRLWSAHFEEYAQFELAELPESFERQRKALPGWARYVLGVANQLTLADISLTGFEAAVTGDVPLGGGMSSSAALEVASAEAFACFSLGKLTIGETGALLTPMQVAGICQIAEHIASGVQCGILDQAASCLGKPGKAVLIDCRSLEYQYQPFEAPDLSLVVIDTSVRRELADSAYNERRQQCEEAARLLGEMIKQSEGEQSATVTTLRDVSPEQFARYAAQLPEILRRRAGYVMAENARVLREVELLKQNDYVQAGELLWRSHAGLRDEYEVSCMELDTLVEIASQVPGVLGARMLGGGFGGCTVNIVRNEALESLRQAVEAQYEARTGRQAVIDVCRPAGGPGYMTLE